MNVAQEIFLDEDKLEQILVELGIEVGGETSTDFICYCPFHNNKDTPAFNISKDASHLWHCWNPSCESSGNLTSLIQRVKGGSPIEVNKYLLHFQPKRAPIVVKKRSARDYEILSDSLIDKLSRTPEHLAYMYGRGFTGDTLSHFQVGYKEMRIFSHAEPVPMIYIPAWDEKWNLIGFARRPLIDIGRKYYDKGLPKRLFLFNLNNAKEHDTVIVVEGPMDCMKVHQAGFPNVVATLSGSLTDIQASLLRRHFRSCIICTDRDDAGRALGTQIADKCRDIRVYWAEYPEGVKDPGEMNEDQIRKAIENKKAHIYKIKGH